MPHVIRESHLEEICSNCKKPHGNNIELINQRNIVYEKIVCENCGYIIIRRLGEKQFEDRFRFM
ncbi:MAG: hypothetical protein KatS3mg002_1158 [Candidatus Woesearchaeota archaeon]|nr:MAG: hypothetical protein KatS3mg002_1158 [Candidatus Woesearchaeota archaeon]